jgi:hypothetical protein
MRTKTNKGTAPEFAVVHSDESGTILEHRTVFSTSQPKAHRKMREMLLWEDDVFVGDVFVLLANGKEVERLVVEVGDVFDPTAEDAATGNHQAA